MKKLFAFTLVLACTTQVISTASADTVFGPGDNVLAIDTDLAFNSEYPAAEKPQRATDQVHTDNSNNASKYLNFGKEGTGLIVTPVYGSSIIQSLRMTTANDAAARDPLTYTLYGTNDPITSVDNTNGDLENWTSISSGNTGLDGLAGDRNTEGVIQDFANATAYTSYKLVFPTIRDAGATNSMQVADVSLFTGATGAGDQILGTGGAFSPDFAIALTVDPPGSNSSYPGGEAPALAIDGDTGNKYLNFGDTNSGFIVSRGDGAATIVDSLTFTTGNDAPGRDPLAYDLYGTNESIVSGDNSLGDGESWTLVNSGSTGLEDFFDTGDGEEHRNETGAAQTFANTTAYDAYRIVFSTLRGGANEGIMQVSEVQFEGTVVPEPTSLVLALFGLIACGCRRK